jgi:hypothetical protein
LDSRHSSDSSRRHPPSNQGGVVLSQPIFGDIDLADQNTTIKVTVLHFFAARPQSGEPFSSMDAHAIPAHMVKQSGQMFYNPRNACFLDGKKCKTPFKLSGRCSEEIAAGKLG